MLNLKFTFTQKYNQEKQGSRLARSRASANLGGPDLQLGVIPMKGEKGLEG